MPEKKCCELAEIAGFIRVSGKVGEGPGGYSLTVTSENPAVTRHYKKLISDYFKIDPVLEIGDSQGIGRPHSYSLAIKEGPESESILRETGMLLVREGKDYITRGIYRDIATKKCDRKSYMRGVFMAAGTVSDPAKGYHLEFVLGNEELAQDMKRLINTFEDLEAKITKRKDRYVVYIKRSEYIRDVLALMGASTQVMAVENARIEKDMIKRTVRITNCDSANTDRAVDAASSQVVAIKKLVESGKIANLSDKLREVAMLRLDNPEASLTELGEMLDPPLKKAGINGRISRIMDYAYSIGIAKK